jgi:ISXO2-like transposase domain
MHDDVPAIDGSTSRRGLLKRGIVGTYHNMSKKYLPLYFAEFQFRCNNRDNTDIFAGAIADC